MGYYTGTGVTSGGGSTVAAFESRIWDGYHTAFQKKTTVVNRKPGVSLATAQAAEGSVNMSHHTFGSGFLTRTYFNCKGTQVNVSYSQIGESNLYELTTTTDTIQVKEDNGAWQS